MLKFLSRFKFFSCLLLLAGCFGGGNYAPVIDRQQPLDAIPESHLVVRGETLYSIAWRYNADIRELAVANSISSPYIIYPGQRLVLKTISGNGITPVPAVAKEQAATTSSRRQRAEKKSETEAINESLGMDKSRYPYRWQWPAPGRVISSYSSSSAIHKGIDLKGKLGEPVYAANSGKVVYAGSGLVGYGKLLIIRHDEHYLSAYGHNRKMKVAEGDLVRVGQQIAEFGDTGTDKVKLHFEIRRDGKPVNPLKLLPAK